MNQIVDEKFKDCSPEETVERIRKILSDNGLSVTEDWQEYCINNCYSLRLSLDGTSFGTNGKGVTPALARASAHAEMMERIQTGNLGSYARLSYPDAVLMDRKTLKENADQLFDSLSKISQNFDNITIPADRFLEAAFEFNGGGDTVPAIPFYNLTDDNTVYIPASLMIPLYSSTGLAAGNSPEEAMVQGMSEIVERWCQRHFLCKGLVPPTIPEDYLKQFPMAYDTISQVRSSGYDVIIKDCSMGLGWPAIATVVIDKKSHAYHVHMGASPVFEIALGRSLTETFQGRVLNSVTDTYLTESPKDSCTYRKSFVKGRGAYPLAYFTDAPSYPFVPFEDRSHCSNRDLLRYALNYFREKNMKIYARDLSHWGFHTYQIIVPDICISHFGPFSYNMNIPALVGSTKKFQHAIKHATEDQLFEQQILNLYSINNTLIDHLPTCQAILKLPIANEYKLDLAVGYAFVGYVEWACGSKSSAIDYARAIERLKVSGISDYFSCLCQALSLLKEGQNLENVLRCLSVFYEDNTISELKHILEKKENPFAPYVVDCSEDNTNCAYCRYAQSCMRENNKKIGQLVNQHANQFDIQKAFSELRALLQSLS